jgi:hypothetical protein
MIKSELLTTLAQPAPTVFGMALKTTFSLQQQLMDITIPLVVHKCIEYLLLPGFGM